MPPGPPVAAPPVNHCVPTPENRISKISVHWLLVNKWLPMWVANTDGFPDYRVLDLVPCPAVSGVDVVVPPPQMPPPPVVESDEVEGDELRPPFQQPQQQPVVQSPSGPLPQNDEQNDIP